MMFFSGKFTARKSGLRSWMTVLCRSLSFSSSLTIDNEGHNMSNIQAEKKKEGLDKALLDIQRKYGGGSIKTGDELAAEKRFEAELDEN